MTSLYQSRVWLSISSALSDHLHQPGAEINEGSRIEPRFTTLHAVVCHVFTLLGKQGDLSQDSVNAVCEGWQDLVSLYTEHAAQYNKTVADQLVSLILSLHLHNLQLYPLIFCTKVLVEECPIPKLSLLQTKTSPIFELLASVVEIVHSNSTSPGAYCSSSSTELLRVLTIIKLYA